MSEVRETSLENTDKRETACWRKVGKGVSGAAAASLPTTQRTGKLPCAPRHSSGNPALRVFKVLKLLQDQKCEYEDQFKHQGQRLVLPTGSELHIVFSHSSWTDQTNQMCEFEILCFAMPSHREARSPPDSRNCLILLAPGSATDRNLLSRAFASEPIIFYLFCVVWPQNC